MKAKARLVALTLAVGLSGGMFSDGASAREKPSPSPTVATDLYIVNGNSGLRVHMASRTCAESRPKLQCSGDGWVDFRFIDNHDEGCQVKFAHKGPHWDSYTREWYAGSLRLEKRFVCSQHWRNSNTLYIYGIRLKPPYPLINQ